MVSVTFSNLLFRNEKNNMQKLSLKIITRNVATASQACNVSFVSGN